MNTKLHSLALAALLFAALPLASSWAQVGVSITVAPPVLPVVEQPPCPVDGYLWTPGYWAHGDADYYLVPGFWAAPPEVGLLWTPPYWGFANGVYAFHDGYWGPSVGFYGGINYGYGYVGSGYYGGQWAGNVFRYNTAVTRVNTTVIHNTYEDRTVLSKQAASHASFNGPGGVKAEPTAEEKTAAGARHVSATPEQVSRQQAASKNRDLQASVNHGHPNAAAIKSLDQGKASSEESANKVETVSKKEATLHTSGHKNVTGPHHGMNETATASHHAQLAGPHHAPPVTHAKASTAQQGKGKPAKPEKPGSQH